MESAEGAVDNGERAIGCETADHVGLVFNHGAIAFFTLRSGLQGAAAFGGGSGEEHIGHRQDANVAADEHEAFVFRICEEGPASFDQRIDAQGGNHQSPGGGAALAEAKGGPDQEREGQVSQWIALDAIDEP